MPLSALVFQLSKNRIDWNGDFHVVRKYRNPAYGHIPETLELCLMDHQYVMIMVNGMEVYRFRLAGLRSQLHTIGGLSPSVNGKHSAIIAEIMQTRLSIDAYRFYIKFYDVRVEWKIFAIPD